MRRPGAHHRLLITAVLALSLQVLRADPPPAAAGSELAIPAWGDADWDDLYAAFLASNLPKDILPPPEVAHRPDSREYSEYLKGYRLGFVEGLLDKESDFDSDRFSHFGEGRHAGERAGARVYNFRAQSRLRREGGFDQSDKLGPGLESHVVTHDSPPEEREALRRYEEFIQALLERIREAYPETVAVSLVGKPRLHCFEYEDYGADNTGKPRRIRRYKGKWDAPGGAGGGTPMFVVAPRQPPGPAAPVAAEDTELHGNYEFMLDYQESQGRTYVGLANGWTNQRVLVWRQVGPAHWQGNWSRRVDQLVTRALRHARPGDAVGSRAEMESTWRTPDAPAVTRPPWLGRLYGRGGHAVAFNRDGTRLLTRGDAGADVWDLRTMRSVTDCAGFEAADADLSADGTRLATADPKDNARHFARVWDVGPDPAMCGEELLAFPHGDRVASVRFSPDGRSLLTVCADGDARLWHLATGQLRLVLEHRHLVRRAEFSPDGSRIITEDDGRARKQWDAQTGRELNEPPTEERPAPPRIEQPGAERKVASPDGKTFLTVGGTSKHGTSLWEAATRTKLLTVRPQAAPGEDQDFHNAPAVAFSPDGRRFAVCFPWDGFTSVFEVPAGTASDPR